MIEKGNISVHSPIRADCAIETANAKVFDRETKALLSADLRELCIEPIQWKKIDQRCPPSNRYIYALQRLGDVSGKDILDFGCGDGYLSIILAKRGARMWAFDISHISVQVTKRRAIANGTENNVCGVRASAVSLPYHDESFDHVIGLDILHHVWWDLAEVGREVFRVLKPGGTAVFKEPFANSRFLRFVRRWCRVKSASDQESGERQLRYSDISVLSQVFDNVYVKKFHILSRLDRVIKRRKVLRSLHVIDEWLLANIPCLGHFARSIVLELGRGQPVGKHQ